MYGLLVGFGLMFDKGQKQSSTLSCDSSYLHIFEPVHEKTNNLGFRPGPTQTGLCSHRSRLEA